MRRVAWLLLGMTVAGCGGPKPLPHEGKSVGQLRRMLADPNPTVQAQGAVGLSLHGPAAKDAIPELVALLDSPRPLVRQQSALALGKIGPEAPDVVPALVRALDDREWTVRRQAVLALGEMGPAAREHVGRIEALRRDPDPVVQQAARNAVQKIRASP